MFPQLTPFGRIFKASGYTLSNTSKVQDIDRIKHYLMSLSDTPPISAMVVVSTSSAARANDADSSRTSTDFPQQLSLFYSGAITDNVGAFMQVTYDDQSGQFGMDNTDIRFADVATISGHDVIYGLSLNNNPTVQDLWNSTPAWGQPFFTSAVLQGPAAATKVEGAMAQSVAGLSAYAFVDQSLYAEVGVYRSALQGASVAQNASTTNDIITGVAPYWRVAYEKDWGQNSWEIGAFGLDAALHNPTTIAGQAVNQSLQAGPTDRFLDTGFDTQYQFIDDDNQITVVGTGYPGKPAAGCNLPPRAGRQSERLPRHHGCRGQLLLAPRVGRDIGLLRPERFARRHLFRFAERPTRQHMGKRRSELSALAEREVGPAIHSLF